MTKPHAGNTGRHDYDGKGFCPCGAEVGCESSDRICSAPNSILWDRLRADLNNLGAAYGPITEGVGEAVVTPEPVEICACCKETGGWHTWRCESGPHPASLYPDKPTTAQLSDTDRNAYFDGIILAARKKREKENRTLIYDPMSDNGHEWSWNTDACAHCGLTSTAIVEFGDVKCDGGKARNGRLTLSAAMSRPLDWEPRVGHRGVPIW